MRGQVPRGISEDEGIYCPRGEPEHVLGSGLFANEQGFWFDLQAIKLAYSSRAIWRPGHLPQSVYPFLFPFPFPQTSHICALLPRASFRCQRRARCEINDRQTHRLYSLFQGNLVPPSQPDLDSCPDPHWHSRKPSNSGLGKIGLEPIPDFLSSSSTQSASHAHTRPKVDSENDTSPRST